MAQSAQMPQSAWDRAHQLGKRAFVERQNDLMTIRSCPENVCLAYRTDRDPWRLYQDDKFFAAWHPAMKRVIEIYGKYSTADALAEELGKTLDNARK